MARPDARPRRGRPRAAPTTPFASLLQEARQRRGLTQGALADRLFCSIRRVQRWESGEGEPGVSELVPLAIALEVSIPELLAPLLPQPPAAGDLSASSN